MPILLDAVVFTLSSRVGHICNHLVYLSNVEHNISGFYWCRTSVYGVFLGLIPYNECGDGFLSVIQRTLVVFNDVDTSYLSHGLNSREPCGDYYKEVYIYTHYGCTPEQYYQHIFDNLISEQESLHVM